MLNSQQQQLDSLCQIKLLCRALKQESCLFAREKERFAAELQAFRRECYQRLEAMQKYYCRQLLAIVQAQGEVEAPYFGRLLELADLQRQNEQLVLQNSDLQRRIGIVEGENDMLKKIRLQIVQAPAQQAEPTQKRPHRQYAQKAVHFDTKMVGDEYDQRSVSVLVREDKEEYKETRNPTISGVPGQQAKSSAPVKEGETQSAAREEQLMLSFIAKSAHSQLRYQRSYLDALRRADELKGQMEELCAEIVNLRNAAAGQSGESQEIQKIAQQCREFLSSL